MGQSKVSKQQKRKTMDRLKAEGRWKPACQRREELRDNGESANQAWLKMEEEFPPLEQVLEELPSPDSPGSPFGQPEKSEFEDVDLGALLEGFEQNSPDLARDTLWVYEKLDNYQVTPKDAPGLGAWSMLKWARVARNRFFEQVLPKAMAVKVQEDEEHEDLDMSLAEAEKLLAEAEATFQTKCTQCGEIIMAVKQEGVKMYCMFCGTEWHDA